MNAHVTNSMEGKDYGEAMDNAIERALTAVAIGIEGDAVSRVPVDSGRLKGSITYATKKKRSYPSGKAAPSDGVSAPDEKWTAHVGTNVEYAQHVEYGTVKMKQQPYLQPALNDNRGRAQRIFDREIEAGLKRGR